MKRKLALIGKDILDRVRDRLVDLIARCVGGRGAEKTHELLFDVFFDFSGFGIVVHF